MSEWKIASEEMPKDGVTVLAKTISGKCYPLFARNGKWFCVWMYTSEDVIAWMYIPEFDIEPYVRQKVMNIFERYNYNPYNGEMLWKYVGWQNASFAVENLNRAFYGVTIKDTMTAEEIVQAILTTYKK